MTRPVVIVSGKRTPIGAFQGVLSTTPAPVLGAHAIRAAVADAALPADAIEEVYMGCVLPAGTGQAPARQAALGADLPVRVGCTTVNKVCGSGLKAVMLAHDAIAAGSVQCVVAGGMENMSLAPHMTHLRAGIRIGANSLRDHMNHDGLEDAYERGTAMGVFADRTAKSLGISRQAQDAFALASLERALAADRLGAFESELSPLDLPGKKGPLRFYNDESPQRAMPEKIPTLKPVFSPDGTITAANASSISDGAAALVLMSEQRAHELGLNPLARIIAHSTHAQAPADFSTAPVGAIRHLFHQTGWSADTVDLFEINEAFAVVTLACMEQLGLAHDKVNVHGGACAIGHPIGASGARILVTLLHALRYRGVSRGVASLCIGGGEAVALAVERL